MMRMYKETHNDDLNHMIGKTNFDVGKFRHVPDI